MADEGKSSESAYRFFAVPIRKSERREAGCGGRKPVGDGLSSNFVCLECGICVVRSSAFTLGIVGTNESIAEIVFTFTMGAGAGAGARAGGLAWPALVLVRVVRVADVLAMIAFCCSQFDCANFSIGFTCRR